MPDLRSDVRILSIIADQMGKPISLPTVAAAASEFSALGNWDGARAPFTPTSATLISGDTILASWRLLLDAGSLQDGETNLANTAHPSVAVISTDRAEKLGVKNGDSVRVFNERGAITLPCEIKDIESNSVWIPRNSHTSKTIATLGVASGASVSVVKA